MISRLVLSGLETFEAIRLDSYGVPVTGRSHNGPLALIDTIANASLATRHQSFKNW